MLRITGEPQALKGNVIWTAEILDGSNPLEIKLTLKNFTGKISEKRVIAHLETLLSADPNQLIHITDEWTLNANAFKSLFPGLITKGIDELSKLPLSRKIEYGKRVSFDAPTNVIKITLFP